MAIITNFTNLKGNSIKLKSFTTDTDAGADNTITLAEYLPDGTTEIANTEQTVPVNGGVRGVKFHSGSDTPNNARTAASDETTNVIGTGAVANSTVGDIFLETDEDRLYERITDSTSQDVIDAAAETPTRVITEGETWKFLSDFTGNTGTTPVISIGTVSTIAAGGTSAVALGSASTPAAPVLDFGLVTGTAGAGFNTYADSTEYAVGDTVISNNTQWRALAVVDNTNTTAPVEGDVWSEITTASQAVSSGITDYNVTQVTNLTQQGYVLVTPDDNPATIPGSFPGIGMTFNVGGTAYNKFNDTTGPFSELLQSNLIFSQANIAIDPSGFQGTVGNGGFRFWQILNTVGLAAADVSADIISQLTLDEDCVKSQDNTVNNGSTWNIDARANPGNTNAFRIYARGTADDLEPGTVTQENSPPDSGWSAVAVARVPEQVVDTTVAGQTFTQGETMVYYNSVLYLRTGETLSDDTTPVTTATLVPSTAGSGWSSIALTAIV